MRLFKLLLLLPAFLLLTAARRLDDQAYLTDDQPWTKQVLVAGSGPFPKEGQTVTVECTGFGKNKDLNKPFWSTKDKGNRPFTFNIGKRQVIPAWDEGVATMQVGEKAVITASPEAAYGSQGFPAWGIDPDSTLKFEIEVLSIGK